MDNTDWAGKPTRIAPRPASLAPAVSQPDRSSTHFLEWNKRHRLMIQVRIAMVIVVFALGLAVGSIAHRMIGLLT